MIVLYGSDDFEETALKTYTKISVVYPGRSGEWKHKESCLMLGKKLSL